MKRGRAVKARCELRHQAGAPLNVGKSGVSLISLSPPRWEDQVTWEHPVAQFRKGSSCDQTPWGACRRERLIASEHVPDGFGETARDVDTRNLAAALLAEPLLGGFVMVVERGMALGVHRRLDERPAQVGGSILLQRAASVLATRLVDAWAQPCVPAELFGRRESIDVADLGRDCVSEHPADSRNRQEVRDVRVVGPESAQPRSQLSISASS
jgi:hypothetical protein